MSHSPISGLRPIKRVITTHDENTGDSILLSYPQPTWETRREGSVGFNNIFTTTGFPCDINQDRDIASHEAIIASGRLGLVNPRGSVCRIIDICPLNPEPLMHRTQSLDYGIVLEGTVELILDSGEVTVLRRGDVAIQRATMHAWRNPSAMEWARILFVLLDCKPVIVGGKKVREDIGRAAVDTCPSGNDDDNSQA